MIRVGILGCANIARRSLAPAFHCHEDFKIVAVASRSREKAAEFSKQYFSKCCTYEELISCAEVDLVYCPLPTGLHYPWVRMALENGKHVLCEKSLACSYAQVKTLVGIASAKNLLLIESFQFRFHAQNRLVLDLINSGVIGKIRSMESRFSFPKFSDPDNIRFFKRLGGGALLDAGAYVIKATTMLLGKDLEIMAASRTVDDAWEVDKDGSLILRRSDGVESHVSYSMDASYCCGYRIVGTSGTIQTTRAFTARDDFDAEVIVNGGIRTCRDDHFGRLLDYVSSLIVGGNFEGEYEEVLTQARLLDQAAERLGLELVGKYAVFGANGYLGSQIAAYLNQRGINADGYDLPDADVTDDAFWSRFDPARYSVILFFCGLTGTKASNEKKELYDRVNEGGLRKLIECLSVFGVHAPKIVFPSSRLVYKGSEHPLNEDSLTYPKTVYAENKLNCERMLSLSGLPYVVLRICVPYGNILSHDYSYGTIGFMEKQASEGRITLYGDGSLKRTFTYVGDICKVVRAVSVDRSITGIYNVGGCVYSLLDVAKIISRRKACEISFVDWPHDALSIESGDTVFDSRKLDDLLGNNKYVDVADKL